MPDITNQDVINAIRGMYQGPNRVSDVDLQQKVDRLLMTLGAQADAAQTNPNAAASALALLKGLLKQLQGTGTGAAPVQLTGSNVILLDRFPVTVTAGAIAYNVISNLDVKNYKSLSVIITTNSVHPIDIGFGWKRSDGPSIVTESAANKTIVGDWGFYKNINEVIVHGDFFNMNLRNQDTADHVYTITVVGHRY